MLPFATKMSLDASCLPGKSKRSTQQINQIKSIPSDWIVLVARQEANRSITIFLDQLQLYSLDLFYS